MRKCAALLRLTLIMAALSWTKNHGQSTSGIDKLAGTNPSPRSNVYAYGYGEVDEGKYELDSGPHLFIDWRYVAAGWMNFVKPDGTEPDRWKKQDIEGLSIKDLRPAPSKIPRGLRLGTIQAQKIGPVLPNDKPWEFMLQYSTLLHFDGKYRMYYTEQVNHLMCYAESVDGINWTKPELGLAEFEGNRRNNIVFGKPLTGHEFHGASVFIDANATAAERFKMIYMTKVESAELASFRRLHPESSAPGTSQVIKLAASPDGIHWKALDGILMQQMSDTQASASYDAVLRKYVGYFRMSVAGRRAVGRSESTRMMAWPMPELALLPSSDMLASDDVYISSKVLYPGTKTAHLMFPTIYRRNNDSLDVVMASSLDGQYWNWLTGEPVISPGRVGEWDGGCVFAGINLTELPDGRVALPFVGCKHPHKFPRYTPLGEIGLAVWEKERLVALIADDEAEFWTYAYQTAGDSLALNFKTGPTGYVRVGIVGRQGRSINDCDPLSGNESKKVVSWGGTTKLKQNKDDTVQLHFRIKNAKLFSFELK